jgi:hypothetical protein
MTFNIVGPQDKPVLAAIEKGHNLWPNGGWVYCEDGFLLPPQKEQVTVLVRTTRGIVRLDGAFWHNPVHGVAHIKDATTRMEFVRTVRWFTGRGNNLTGVVCWYYVPNPTSETLQALLHGQT